MLASGSAATHASSFDVSLGQWNPIGSGAPALDGRTRRWAGSRSADLERRLTTNAGQGGDIIRAHAAALAANAHRRVAEQFLDDHQFCEWGLDLRMPRPGPPGPEP